MKHVILYATSCAVLGLSGVANAQSDNTQGANPAAGDQLAEIVVTAQRRGEKLQEVPISVVALQGSELTGKGAIDPASLNQAVPGLVASKGIPATLVFLRGVGQNGANPNDEASVATYVDGVYIASAVANVFSYNNIERLEVLKGPQGTLFGRNATGGVIQVITRDPGQASTVEGRIGYGNYDTLSASLYAATPVSSELSADIAVQYDNQRDGYGRNVFLNRDIRLGKSFSARSKWVWEHSADTKLTLAFDYGYSRSNYTDFRLPPGVPGIDGNPTPTGQDTATDVYNKISVRQGGVSGKLQQNLGFADLVVISAYRKGRGQFVFDPDATPFVFVAASLPNRQHNVSEEVQLLSRPGSKIDWVLGGFYYNNTAGYYNGYQTGAAFGGLPFFKITSYQHTKSVSGYGQATAPIGFDTKLTLGLRYTDENQKANAVTETIFGRNIAPESKQGFSRLTWRAALDHKFSEDIHAYVSYNRGIKSGGFDLLSPGSPGYKPEILDAYEAGIKTELFDRRVRVNIGFFYYDYKDIQVQAIIQSTTGPGTTVSTTNAAAAHIKGIDFDSQVKVTRSLTLSGGFEILDGKYVDFTNAPFYPLSPLAGSGQIDASGNRTVRSPKFTGNISADYTVDTKVGQFDLNLSASHMSHFYWAPDNVFDQRAYTLFNSSIGWTSNDKRWGITIWGRNLTKEKYLSTGVPGVFGALSVPGAPRTYGASANFKI